MGSPVAPQFTIEPPDKATKFEVEAPSGQPDHEVPSTFWDTVYDRSGLGAIQKLTGSLSDWAQRKAGEKEVERLGKVSQGQNPKDYSSEGMSAANYDLLARAAKFVSGSFSPKALAASGAIAAANTNPITGIPVDVGLIAHGGYTAVKNAPAALQGNPEAAESALLGGAEAAGAGAGLGAVRPSVGGNQVLARRLYQSALKPSTTLEPAERAAILQTGLEKGIPVSEAGATKIASSLADLQNQVKATIARNPNAPISTQAVASRLNPVMQRAAQQVNPMGDLGTISDVGQEFTGTHPGQIPATQAQAIKTGTYQALGEKSFGELKGASIEAQKALARGLKEELENQFPELKNLNAQQKQLFDLAIPINRALGRINNRELLGIGTPIAGGAAEAVTGNAHVGMAAAIMKQIFEHPEVKSRLAIALNRSGLSLKAANARVAEFSSALSGQAANEGEQ
jgi:hypothetical protein